jgi:putative phosphoesterase
MKAIRVGVISDTHNLLRPEAVEALKDSDLIVHAGDVCRPEILEALETIAPVRAVRGNNDKGEWARRIPVTEIVNVGQISIYVIHDLKELDAGALSDERIKVVVSGHSHKPYVEKRGEILYLNPGSAGRRRFSLPISLARLEVAGKNVDAEIVLLTG